jgi:hypothetical protein
MLNKPYTQSSQTRKLARKKQRLKTSQRTALTP